MILELTGIFLGVITRVFFPWVRKLKRGKVKDFKIKYFYSALGSIIFGFIISLLVLPQFQGLQSSSAGIEAFAVAFGFGFGWHSIVNEAGKWSKAFS